jgi:hypothetical protein
LPLMAPRTCEGTAFRARLCLSSSYGHDVSDKLSATLEL